MSPARPGGPYGTACRGAGSVAQVQYGYRVNYTANDTDHYAFLGDTDTSIEVRYDKNKNTCTFALLFLAAKYGPFQVTIAGRHYDISTAQAEHVITLYVRG